MPEEMTKSKFAFLRSGPVLAVTIVLLLQIALFYAVPTKEYIPSPPPLNKFALSFGPWHMLKEVAIDAYTQSFLRSDDSLSRDYAGPADVELFVAFFKSQRGGVTPHSPKVCLPGNGWTAESSRIIAVNVPGEPKAIPVNRFVVSYGEQHKLVLYWYQNPYRVTANEYLSKFYLIFDAFRYHRSDEALIRVIVNLGGPSDTHAEEQAIQFIQAVYRPLKQQMWVGPATAALLQRP